MQTIPIIGGAFEAGRRAYRAGVAEGSCPVRGLDKRAWQLGCSAERQESETRLAALRSALVASCAEADARLERVR